VANVDRRDLVRCVPCNVRRDVEVAQIVDELAHIVSLVSMASKRRCRMTICSRSVRRTMSIGSTSTARSGRFSTSSLAVLINPSDPSAQTLTRDLAVTARALGVTLHLINASSERDFDAAFAVLQQRQAGALIIGADPFFNSRSEQLAQLAARHAVPAIYQYRTFAAAGGLMSYGSPLTEPHRLAGTYVGRVLKGEKPAELPVQQATKLELIINLKTAKALGLTVPETLLARADEVIE
jgi:putative tryptophan/tyrosine transport system substrate-binding protein